MPQSDAHPSEEPHRTTGHRCAWWGWRRFDFPGEWRPEASVYTEPESGMKREDVPQAFRFRSVAAGNFGAAGINTDGTIICWGYQFTSQGPRNAEERAREGIEGCDWVRISCRRWGKFTGVLALKRDGTLGQAGFVNPWPPAAERYIDIASSTDCDAALREDGRVRTWSWNSETSHLSDETFTELANQPDHVSARREDGSWVWWTAPGPPREVKGPGTPLRRIFLHPVCSLGLDEDGILHGWGDLPTEAPLGERFITLARGMGGVAGLRTNGRVVMWPHSRESPQMVDSLRGRCPWLDSTRFVDVQATKMNFIGLVEDERKPDELSGTANA
ncbi:MAG: hypothetical protein CMJ34_11570 [Phycisphaerae bacterium]|nr:hypothetical protein [Phycisphaerae bacterium]